MRERHLKTTDDVSDLEIGEVVYITGKLLTARDMAHKRFEEFSKNGKKIPFKLSGGMIFHAGPIVKKSKGKFGLVAIGATASFAVMLATARLRYSSRWPRQGQSKTL